MTGPLPPLLVARGECDFVRWEYTRAYRDTLGATMVVIPGAGHSLWPAQPELMNDLFAAFFRGEPLPLPACTAATEPPGLP